MLVIIRHRIIASILLYKNIKIKINRTIILPVVLDEYETSSLILREEHRMRIVLGIGC
jgi:hypothetical protein